MNLIVQHVLYEISLLLQTVFYLDSSIINRKKISLEFCFFGKLSDFMDIRFMMCGCT